MSSRKPVWAVVCLLAATATLSACSSSSEKTAALPTISATTVTATVTKNVTSTVTVTKEQASGPAALAAAPEPMEAVATPETKPATQGAGSGDVPAEYRSALRKAKTYVETMHMSKAGLYQQLTSEYGEQFTADQAQYAIDHLPS